MVVFCEKQGAQLYLPMETPPCKPAAVASLTAIFVSIPYLENQFYFLP